LKHMEIIDQV